MEEEGVPSTALREVSLLQMLSESAFIVRCVPHPIPRDTDTTPHRDPQTQVPNGFFKQTEVFTQRLRANPGGVPAALPRPYGWKRVSLLCAVIHKD
jgi:hypothetical protein|tara:strand:- start:328 stop:615 length:288 start_codon:yes stop_codon:yes gene_type:complete